MNVFSVAQKLEKDASDLYNSLALHARANSLRDLMAELAMDHRSRYRTFNALTDQGTCPSDTTPNLHLITEALVTYLRAAKSGRKLQDMGAFIRNIMAFEATTADFYQEIQSLVSSAAAQSLVQDIIEGERRDCSMVEEFYEFVNAPNEFLADAEFSNLDEFHQFGRQIG